MPARLALVLGLAVISRLLSGCGVPPDPRTVQQAVDEAVEAEPVPRPER